MSGILSHRAGGGLSTTVSASKDPTLGLPRGTIVSEPRPYCLKTFLSSCFPQKSGAVGQGRHLRRIQWSVAFKYLRLILLEIERGHEVIVVQRPKW